MFAQSINVWFCVGTGIISILGVALIVWALKFSSPICPNCGKRVGNIIVSRRIPGTEHDLQSSERFNLYAKYWNRYECQNCGHKWSEEETRQLT